MNKIDPALIFLSLLFVYDIFWVFVSPYVFPAGKSVMVEVATSMDLPNKLIMPALFLGETARGSMLGLGDIIIPGLYLTFLDNLDKVSDFKTGSSKSKPSTLSYFWSGLFAYALSFVACAVVIVIFDSAQPVLLYIVPLLFLATFITAYVKGHLAQLRQIDVRQD